MGDTFVAYLHRNKVGYNFHESLLNMVVGDRGLHIAELRDKFSTPLRIGESRNAAVQAFLDETDLEWLFFVDDDMGFQPNSLALLHAIADPVERPIVGGLCFMQQEKTNDKRGGFTWCPKPTIYDYVDMGAGPTWTYRHHYPINGLVRCDGTGGAFLLIHRTVFERLGTDWFLPLPDVGEDLSFFHRCGQAGIPCHVFTGVRTNHLKETHVGEADFWASFDSPPAVDEIDVIVPVLHRPQNIEPFMQSLRASTGLATAWFVCERGDTVEQDAVEKNGGRVLRCDGSFATKVNYAYRKIKSGAPWLFLTGDDVQFRPGWLDHAQFAASAYGADVVGTNDLGNAAVMRGDHATHMLIRRSYVDQVGASWDGPGNVCHEGYRHWYVDNELVAAARQRGVWQMALGSIVEHMHPLWGKGLDDPVYELGQSFAAADAEVWARRLAQYGQAA